MAVPAIVTMTWLDAAALARRAGGSAPVGQPRTRGPSRRGVRPPVEVPDELADSGRHEPSPAPSPEGPVDRGRCCRAHPRRPRHMAGDAPGRNAAATPVSLGDPDPADVASTAVQDPGAGNVQPRTEADRHGRTQADTDPDGDGPAPGGTDRPADPPPHDRSPASSANTHSPAAASDTGTGPVHCGPAPGTVLTAADVPRADAVAAAGPQAVPHSHRHADGQWRRRADHDLVHLPRGGRRRSAHGRRRGGRGPRVLAGRRGPARPEPRPARHAHRHRELRGLLVPDLVEAWRDRRRRSDQSCATRAGGSARRAPGATCLMPVRVAAPVAGPFRCSFPTVWWCARIRRPPMPSPE